MAEKIIYSPEGTKHRLPENIAPEVDEFATKVYEKPFEEYAEPTYGHAAKVIANSAVASAISGKSPESQVQIMRDKALGIIEKHGPKIVPLLREELQLALTEEDLASIGY